ncbi:uncharacterized protein I206_100084 [Kwoniella pini CBS 10737]|uniref:Uncharacterized protein n=1 Tax=Kwoniella pini CBS 10737 TaxID=1296096 RepID=A0A1B9IEQ2_9TREE|nr:uncharacterized protein I206_01244 [Kwoniella pini CBS 10737]OCF53937.1 hypothetical protein I206_01244 [Kwoniella pini CBS 10737]
MATNDYYATQASQIANPNYGGTPSQGYNGYNPNVNGGYDPNQQIPPPIHTQYAPQPQLQMGFNSNQPSNEQTDKGVGSNAATCCGLGACCLCCLECCAIDACCDAVF